MENKAEALGKIGGFFLERACSPHAPALLQCFPLRMTKLRATANPIGGNM
jgi:hypothetical protein